MNGKLKPLFPTPRAQFIPTEIYLVDHHAFKSWVDFQEYDHLKSSKWLTVPRQDLLSRFFREYSIISFTTEPPEFPLKRSVILTGRSVEYSVFRNSNCLWAYVIENVLV